MMTDLDTFDGWAIWDDRITASSYFVMQTTTDEGVGNEMYTYWGWMSSYPQIEVRVAESFRCWKYRLYNNRLSYGRRSKSYDNDI
jgi:hypothetical protein